MRITLNHNFRRSITKIPCDPLPTNFLDNYSPKREIEDLNGFEKEVYMPNKLEKFTTLIRRLIAGSKRRTNYF